MVLPAAVSDGPAAPAARTKAGTVHVAGNGQVAAAGAAKATASPASHPKRHPNVGRAHSPRLLKELAGPSGTSGPVINGPAQAATAGPVNGAAQGIDVASFQEDGGIKWDQVASDGIKFAAVKATEGDYYTNPDGPDDLVAAHDAGLTTVAYAYAIPDGDGSSKSPVRQADDLINYLTSNSVTVPPVMLDIEYNPNPDGTGACYGLSKSAMVTWITGFNAEIRAKTGRLPFIYTTQDWWQTCTGDSAAFGNTPIWQARICGSSCSSPAPYVGGWRTWNLWQYSSTGTVDGISGNVDLDQLNPGVISLLNHGNRSYTAGSTTLATQVTPFTAGSAPSLTYKATGLPTGLSMLPDGRISGWPDKKGTYHPVLTATDSSGTTGSAAFTWTITAASSSGPTGPVRLGTGGKCLDDYRSGTSNGNKVDTSTCNGWARQKWVVVQDDTVRIHGKCLRVRSGGTANGTVVDLWSCTGSNAQEWRVGTGGQLVNTRSGKCLAGSGTRNGKQAWIWSCTGRANQKWILPAGPVVSGIPGKCLDDSGNSSANLTKIVIWACSSTAAQQWVAEPDGTVRIHGKCLQASGGGTTSGTLVDLYSCTGSSAQQWQIPARGSGSTLVNVNSGLCLADPNDSTADGTQAVIQACSAADPGMTWRVH